MQVKSLASRDALLNEIAIRSGKFLLRQASAQKWSLQGPAILKEFADINQNQIWADKFFEIVITRFELNIFEDDLQHVKSLISSTGTK